MICLLVASLAARAGALRDAHTYDAGTVVEDVAAAPDGRTLAFIETGSDTLWVVRTDTWKAYPSQPCNGLVGLGAYPNGYAVGCDNGSIALVDTSLRKPLPEPVIVPEAAGTPILGVTADATNVYVIAENVTSGAYPVILAVSIESRAPAKGPWPATLGFPDYRDAETDGQYVIVSHGADNVSKVDITTASVSIPTTGVGYADCRDVDTATLSVLLACQIGLVEFTPSTNDMMLVLGSKKEWFHVESVWIDEIEDLVWFFDSQDGLFVYSYDSKSGTVTDDLVGAVPDPHGSSEMAGVPGYAFLGTDGGDVHVYTELPWVAVEDITEPALNGQTVDITFTSDIAGDYQVMLGELQFAKGSVVANEPVTVPITIDASFIEGENVIMVTVTESTGEQGHGGVAVIVNNPPSQVVLQEGDLGWGDSKLFLTFSGIDDEDLTSYLIYVSTAEFDPADLPTGPPPDSITLPPVPGMPGEPVSIEIAPLINETTYYVAVRAIDATGLEGPMSVVLSGTPHETFTAAELAGEEGGFSCASARSRAPIAALILVGLAAIRRRGVVAALALLALGGTARADDDTSDDTSTETTGTTETTETSTTETTSTPPPPTTPPPTTTTTTATPPPPAVTAPAAPVVIEPALPGSVTVVHSEVEPKFRAGLEVRFGPLWFDDNNPINDVYGNSGNNLLMVEGGPSFKDILLLEFGLGRYHRRGHLVAEDGTQSSDESVITAFPLTLSGRVRLDFFEEQWVVPTVAAGLDYWLWNEKAGYDSAAMSWDAKQSGGHYGYHYAAGLQILLDTFEQKRASQLHARSGIDDSYIVTEYRHREVGEDEGGLKFTGSEFTVGLRIGF